MRCKVPLCSPESLDETSQDDIATIEGDEVRIIRPECLGSMDILQDRESGEKRVVSPRRLGVFEEECRRAAAINKSLPVSIACDD